MNPITAASTLASGATAVGGMLSGGIRQRRAHRYGISNAKNQYKYAVEGMEKAGINPVLAFASGMGVNMPGGASSAGQSGQTDIAGSLQKGAQRTLLKKQVDQVDADIALKAAQANKHRMEALGLGINNARAGRDLNEETERWRYLSGSQRDELERMWREQGRGAIYRNMGDIEALGKRLWDQAPSAQNSVDFMREMQNDLQNIKQTARDTYGKGRRRVRDTKESYDYYRTGDFIPDVPFWMSPALNLHQRYRGEDRKRARRRRNR